MTVPVNPSLIGKLAERLVDLSFSQYDLWWSPTWPEVVFIAKGRARATGRALPDRICLRPDGRLIMFEIKTWQAKDRYTLRKRLHQYDTLADVANGGGTCFYLVLWRWKGGEEWRLYPIDTLEKTDSIVFTREEGKLVSGEIPDWLPVLDGGD